MPEAIPPRPVDLVVVSDVHLGAPCSRAAELNSYLKSISPGRLILAGDIVDLWEIRRGHWPEAHTKVVRRILKMALAGVPVHWLAGNHDGALRQYLPFALGQLDARNHLELEVGGRRTFFCHGDACDALLATPRWLAVCGAWSYDALVEISTWINRVRGWGGAPPVALAQSFKRNLPSARRHIERFVNAVSAAAAARGCDAVVCGHIHLADQRRIAVDGRDVLYLNSGDWVDSCTALECHGGIWQVVRFADLVERGLAARPSPGPEADLPAAVPA